MAPIEQHICLLAAGVILVGCSPGRPGEPSLTPGVRIGKGLLEKQLLVQCTALGQVTDIQVGRIDGQTRSSLILAGTYGFAEVDSDSQQILQASKFEPVLRPPFDVNRIESRTLDLDGDGDLEFIKLDNGPRWGGRTSLHGGDGKLLCAPFPEDIWSSVPVDLDGDGDIEFLQTVSGETRLVDHRGELIWSQEWPGGGPATGMLFLDVDQDGRKDIVYAEGTAVRARDASGKLLSETRLPRGEQVGGLWLLRGWGGPPRDWMVIRESSGGDGQPVKAVYYLLSMDTKTLGREIAWEEIQARTDAIPVQFSEAPTFAWAKIKVLSEPAFFAGTKRARVWLRIVDASGATLYEEVLSPPQGEERILDAACLFLPATENRRARLLVGYGSCVWAYVVKQ